MTMQMRAGVRPVFQEKKASGVFVFASGAAIAMLLLGGVGPNFLFAVLAVIIFVIGIVLLFRPEEPPILVLTFFVPWLQSSIGIFHANWLGITLSEYSPFRGDMESAVVLSLLGIGVLAIGMRLGIQGLTSTISSTARETALSWPLSRWFQLYAAAFGISSVIMMFTWVIPGLSQILLAFAVLKWAFYYIVVYAAVVKKRIKSLYFIGPFLLELVSGIGGFFSDFKTVFLVTIVAFAASGAKINARHVAPLGLFGALLIVFMVVWTAVKGEYRAYVNQGSGLQIVSVDYASRIGKLVDLVSALDGDALTKGLNNFLHRLTYVDFFSVTLDTVPGSIPYEDGAITADAIVRPFMPRLFFPDKTVINDSERTNRFARGLAGNSKGTSVSLGYVAEFYIDFGPYFMFAALLALGWLYGRIYRYFLSSAVSRGLLGMGLATSLLILVGPLDNSFTKVFGGVAVSFIAAQILSRIVIPMAAPWVMMTRSLPLSEKMK